ncbi:MAG: hypothetical protein GY749_45635 [Desulfobacteraceae bacterium]|nr:hypothetical protein [Desulfobacteraceae bacterium]
MIEKSVEKLLICDDIKTVKSVEGLAEHVFKKWIEFNIHMRQDSICFYSPLFWCNLSDEHQALTFDICMNQILYRELTPEEHFTNMLFVQKEQGWKKAPVYDSFKKHTPNLVRWDQLAAAARLHNILLKKRFDRYMEYLEHLFCLNVLDEANRKKQTVCFFIREKEKFLREKRRKRVNAMQEPICTGGLKSI